ncbi:hypothetical protein [Bacteroides intestinalis]|uniref:hypothetical protein n=1 Tax=Bacteroides intestinalis TaxID=329854 RepID=UPI000E1E08CC|nr:hypothetical protein [Bacteroides intestinalis]QDO68796.1 hypothetical protein DXK01_007580 [Bacteroides intestinalis]UCB37025.1 hypothetical protein I1225_07545 [Bacteroides intestinalis]UCB41268.1 hypothetical protein I1224_07550 [Bacteroides intestinalis]
MAKSTEKQNIFFLKNISIDNIVEKHIALLEERAKPQRVITNFQDVTCDSTFMAQYETVQGKSKAIPRKLILHEKYTFLIHKLIKRCRNNKEGDFTRFNTKVLQATLGAVYKDMLNTLVAMNIIRIANEYIPTIQARLIEFNSNLSVSSEMRYNAAVDKYDKKMEQELKKYEKEQLEEIRSEIGNELYDNFIKSLNLLHLTHETEAKDYLNRHKFMSAKSKEYFSYILEEYKKKDFKILSVDRNLRIYTLLTQSPRIFKNFTNIKFTCDIHNSHPLLFNKIIIDKYNIDNNILHILYNNINNIDNSLYSVGKELRKLLINNNIQECKIENIPNDIWEYIYKTSKGVFWDDFTDLNEFKRLLRSDIKVTLFREVFYSKTLTTKGKDFAKVFKKKYPSVYKLIKESKKNDRTFLANQMMRIESDIFRSILTKLYAKKFRVLTIHDAVIVLDVKANTKCNPELVQSIIGKEYQRIGLFPNSSVDYYSTENVAKELQQEEQDLKLINELIENFRVIANDEAHPKYQSSKEIIEELEKGTAEIYINHRTNQFVWHPLF